MDAPSLVNGSQRIVSSVIAEAVAEEVLLERFPGIEHRPKVFYAYMLATATLIQPGLEGLARAYKQACSSPLGRDAALRFLSVVLETEAEA